MGVPSHGEGKPKTRETALQKDETSLGLGAVARRRTCQADDSSDEFCQGWQLANEKKGYTVRPTYPSANRGKSDNRL